MVQTQKLIKYDYKDITAITSTERTMENCLLEEYCEDLVHERIIHMMSIKYCDTINDNVIHIV